MKEMRNVNEEMRNAWRKFFANCLPYVSANCLPHMSAKFIFSFFI